MKETEVHLVGYIYSITRAQQVNVCWGSSSAVVEGGWGRGHMPPGASREGAPKDGCGNSFCDTKYRKIL